MENKLVSIIVPIYNVEKYLRDCVDSILNQTYKQIQVILVDDKTPDNSGNIADEYARRDDRVVVIHKPKNEGLNMARATGFAACSGEFVMFVDSDDMISKDCVEFSLRALTENDADFVKLNVLNFDSKELLPSDLISVDEDDRKEIIVGRTELYKARFHINVVGTARVTVWGGLYSSDIVKKIDWKESNYRQFEDGHWTLQLLEHSNKAVYLSRVGYFYRVDDADDSVLSKQLTKNSFNGQQIGSLEFVERYSKKLQQYNEKYELGIDNEISKFITWMWLDRLSRLVRTGLISSENNLEYLPYAVDAITRAYKGEQREVVRHKEWVANIKHTASDLRDELNAVQDQVNTMRNELESYQSIKRSSRLLLGNIKRKVRSIIK